jgi:putative ABC transport system ATP-binding protein
MEPTVTKRHVLTDSQPETSLKNTPMIKLLDIEKVYQTDTIETVALNRVNLTINKGEFVSIMGPSGCGKSTLLSLMGLLDEPTSGAIEIDGRTVTSYSDKELARLRNHKIGFIFQSFHLINDLSVLDNVELPLLYRSGMSGKERQQRAQASLEKVGLSTRTRHFPSQLSGGQRQRVAIARAVAGAPEIILADEPTGNLDSVMGDEIMDLLLNLHRNEGTTIVMVTHDENMAHKTERLIRFFDGSQVS